MIALVFFTLLLANQASSSPVPIEQSKADAKVMNCVVEVISDTLSKPSPLPISQECMEVLRGDERIIGMLRHQNLLRELQELAAEGANEKALQKKQNNDYKEKQLPALENHEDKKISPSDNSQKNPAEEQQRSSTEKVGIKDEEEEETTKERQLAVRRHSFMNIKDTTTDSSSIATDGDRGTARKVPIGDEPMKNGSTENEFDVDQPQNQRQSVEHSTEAHEDENTQEEKVGESKIKENEEENKNHYEDGKDEELTYSEEPSQEDWGDEATNGDNSNVEENGKVSDEEIWSNENKSHQNSEKVEEEYSSKRDGKDELSEEWEVNKQNVDESAPERKLRHGETSDEGKSIRFENPKPHSRHGHFQHLQGNTRSHPEEDGQKEKVPIASSALQTRLDVEDKKEEEGSATRKNEEQEVESLEEIESELEAMARRLHQMRSS